MPGQARGHPAQLLAAPTQEPVEGAQAAGARRQVGADPQGKGADQHGDHARPHEEAHLRLVEETEAAPQAGENERELPDLGDGEAGHQCHLRREARGEAGHRGESGLAHEQGADEAENGARRRGQHPHVEEHPHRDEEEAGEDLAQGEHVGEGLVPVLGVGQHDPGEEGPEGEREPGQGGEPGDAGTDDEHGQDEQVPAPAEGDEVEGLRDHAPGQEERGHHHERRQPQGPRHRHRAPALTGEHGDEEDHRHDAEVLEEQHSHDQPAVGGVGLATLGQGLEHDRRRGEGGEKPEEDPPGRRVPGEVARQGDREHGQRHLEPAADEKDGAEAAQLLQRELEPDREEQQDDTDLGEPLDLVDVADPAEAARADEGAGDEEPGDGGQAQATQHEDDYQGRAEQHHQVAEYVQRHSS